MIEISTHEYNLRILYYIRRHAQHSNGGIQPSAKEQADGVAAGSVAALFCRRRDMAVALRALNDMTPKWGAVIASASTCAARKGVHTPDPRDESVAAWRAIELPPPFDSKISTLSQALADGEDGIDCEVLAGKLGMPATLVSLVQSGEAVFEPEFERPCELDDLNPCPPADPQWAQSGAHPLPAQEAPDAGAQYSTTSSSRSFTPVPFRFIELFAGIGGFRLACEALGGKCVFASEFHPTSRAIYQENWPMCGRDSDIFAGDIRLVRSEEIPEHDILTAGFPCQPFSALGEQRGLDDCRGQLFMHICRVLRTRRPAAALLENVPGLMDTDEGRALEIVFEELRASGYRLAHRIYNSQCLLPQKRKRVYIVAIRADLEAACEDFRFPWLPDLGRTLEEALEEPVPSEEADALFLSEARWLKMKHSRAFQEDPEDILRQLNRPAAPLVSNYGSGAGRFVKYTQLVPSGQGNDSPPRRFSCRECARLQGFPETFSYNACEGPPSWYKAIGNAVGPPLVCAMAGAIVCAIQHPGRQCRLPGTGAAIRLALQSGPEGTRETLLSREVVDPAETTLTVRALLELCE